MAEAASPGGAGKGGHRKERSPLHKAPEFAGGVISEGEEEDEEDADEVTTVLLCACVWRVVSICFLFLFWCFEPAPAIFLRLFRGPSPTPLKSNDGEEGCGLFRGP